MNIVEQAEKDLSFTLEDKDNGFAVDAILTDPNNVSYTIKAQTTDIGFFIDPGAGVGIRGRNVEIVFRLSTLLAQGATLPIKKNWKFQFVNVNIETWDFAVELIDVDRKLGVVKMIVGLLDAS